MNNPIAVAIDPRAFEHARQQIARIKDATIDLVEAMHVEHRAIQARDEYLAAYMAALIGQPNGLTNKPHSQESAERAGKQDEQYKRLAASRIEAECARLMASAASEAQRLHARLSVSVVEHAIPSGDLH